MSNTYRQKINLYQRNRLTTGSPSLQVAMILEKAAASLETAVKAATEGRIEERYNHSIYAIRLLRGLAAVLQSNDDSSKEMVQVLTEYYSFMLVRISEFNHKEDISLAHRLIYSLQEMAGCWRSLGATPPCEEQPVTVET